MRGELGYLGRVQACAKYFPSYEVDTTIHMGSTWQSLYQHGTRRMLQTNQAQPIRDCIVQERYLEKRKILRSTGRTTQDYILERFEGLGPASVIVTPNEYPAQISPCVSQNVFWYQTELPWRVIDHAYDLWRRKMCLSSFESFAYQNLPSGQSVRPTVTFPYNHFHILSDASKIRQSQDVWWLDDTGKASTRDNF